MRKIGLYGGSFDPIHFGHISLALQLKEIHSLDEIWFCPNYKSPLKSIMPRSAHHRLEMLKLAVNDCPFFKVLEDEINRMGSSYTIDTITSILEKESDISLYLIIAEDNLPSLHLWKDIDKIISLTHLIAGKRQCETTIYEGSPSLRQAVEKGLTRTKIMEISATEIRNRLKNKLYCSHLLPAKVLDYIYQNDLY